MKKLVALFLFSFIANLSFAQQETLAVDTSFGEEGIFTENNLSESSFFVFENKIYIAGKRGSSGSPWGFFTLIRLNMDGTPDMTFNAGSNYFFNYNQFQFTYDDTYQTVIQQPDGKILVISRHLLFRINPDGSVDNSFGEQGVISCPLPEINYNIGYNDGKIYRVFLKKTISYELYVERLNVNGEIDSDYGVNGLRHLSTVGVLTDGDFKSMGFLSNGELLFNYRSYMVFKVSVNGDEFISPQFFLHRFEVLDDYFVPVVINNGEEVHKYSVVGDTFVLLNSFSISSFVHPLLKILNDGKYYILGFTHWYESPWDPTYGFVITRRLENGDPDNTFSGNGDYVFQNLPSQANPNRRIESFKILNNDFYLLAKNVTTNRFHLYKYNLVEDLSTDEQLTNGVKIYPNPATDKIYFENLKTASSVKVLNAEGKFIIEKTIQPKEFIDISALPKGVYVAVLDGNSYKFIKN